jgi:hypothetical protein
MIFEIGLKEFGITSTGKYTPEKNDSITDSKKLIIFPRLNKTVNDAVIIDNAEKDSDEIMIKIISEV